MQNIWPTKSILQNYTLKTGWVLLNVTTIPSSSRFIRFKEEYLPLQWMVKGGDLFGILVLKVAVLSKARRVYVFVFVVAFHKNYHLYIIVPTSKESVYNTNSLPKSAAYLGQKF